MSTTDFHGPIDVWAIEVWLYFLFLHKTIDCEYLLELSHYQWVPQNFVKEK